MPTPTWYAPPAPASAERPSQQPEPVREREYIEVEKPNARLRAYEQALAEYAKRHPGSAAVVTTIESYAEQLLSGKAV